MKTSPQNVKGRIEQDNRRIFSIVLKKTSLLNVPILLSLDYSMKWLHLLLRLSFSFLKLFFLFALKCVWWWCRKSQRMPRVNHKNSIPSEVQDPCSLWFKDPLRFYQIYLAEGSLLFPLLSLCVPLLLFVSLSPNPPGKNLYFS